MMTARDPYVNVMRGAIAAFSAGLGGADSVSVLPHTLAVGMPDESRAPARPQRRSSSCCANPISALSHDPAAGAGGFEALTHALCEKGWALFQAIEALGGLPAALANGAFQARVAESAGGAQARRRAAQGADHRRQRASDLAEGPVDVAPGAPEREQLAAAEGALRRYASPSLSSACATCRTRRLTATGARPKACLIALGPEPAHRRRVAFMREWLEAGGIEPVYHGETATPEEAANRVSASGASLACLCGDDETYAAHAEAFARRSRPPA